MLTAAAGYKGGVIVAAAGNTMDGTRRDFIAKTDNAGHTVRSVTTENFSPQQVCETVDDDVWTLGYDWAASDGHNADKFVVRRYRFERGFISKSLTVELDSAAVRGPSEKTYLQCGNDRVSVFLPRSDQYVEIDTTTGNLTRWKVDMSSAVGPASRGFAITEHRRVFVALANSDHAHQLYELCAVQGKPVATLTPIVGTVDANNDASKYTVEHLWGADGNDLIVQRQGDGWGVSWVKLISSPSTPD